MAGTLRKTIISELLEAGFDHPRNLNFNGKFGNLIVDYVLASRENVKQLETDLSIFLKSNRQSWPTILLKILQRDKVFTQKLVSKLLIFCIREVCDEFNCMDSYLKFLICLLLTKKLDFMKEIVPPQNFQRWLKDQNIPIFQSFWTFFGTLHDFLCLADIKKEDAFRASGLGEYEAGGATLSCAPAVQGHGDITKKVKKKKKSKIANTEESKRGHVNFESCHDTDILQNEENTSNLGVPGDREERGVTTTDAVGKSEKPKRKKKKRVKKLQRDDLDEGNATNSLSQPFTDLKAQCSDGDAKLEMSENEAATEKAFVLSKSSKKKKQRRFKLNRNDSQSVVLQAENNSETNNIDTTNTLQKATIAVGECVIVTTSDAGICHLQARKTSKSPVTSQHEELNRFDDNISLTTSVNKSSHSSAGLQYSSKKVKKKKKSKIANTEESKRGHVNFESCHDTDILQKEENTSNLGVPGDREERGVTTTDAVGKSEKLKRKKKKRVKKLQRDDLGEGNVTNSLSQPSTDLQPQSSIAVGECVIVTTSDAGICHLQARKTSKSPVTSQHEELNRFDDNISLTTSVNESSHSSAGLQYSSGGNTEHEVLEDEHSTTKAFVPSKKTKRPKKRHSKFSHSDAAIEVIQLENSSESTELLHNSKHDNETSDIEIIDTNDESEAVVRKSVERSESLDELSKDNSVVEDQNKSDHEQMDENECTIVVSDQEISNNIVSDQEISDNGISLSTLKRGTDTEHDTAKDDDSINSYKKKHESTGRHLDADFEVIQLENSCESTDVLQDSKRNEETIDVDTADTIEDTKIGLSSQKEEIVVKEIMLEDSLSDLEVKEELVTDSNESDHVSTDDTTKPTDHCIHNDESVIFVNQNKKVSESELSKDKSYVSSTEDKLMSDQEKVDVVSPPSETSDNERVLSTLKNSNCEVCQIDEVDSVLDDRVKEPSTSVALRRSPRKSCIESNKLVNASVFDSKSLVEEESITMNKKLLKQQHEEKELMSTTVDNNQPARRRSPTTSSVNLKSSSSRNIKEKTTKISKDRPEKDDTNKESDFASDSITRQMHDPHTSATLSPEKSSVQGNRPTKSPSLLLNKEINAISSKIDNSPSVCMSPCADKDYVFIVSTTTTPSRSENTLDINCLKDLNLSPVVRCRRFLPEIITSPKTTDSKPEELLDNTAKPENESALKLISTRERRLSTSTLSSVQKHFADMALSDIHSEHSQLLEKSECLANNSPRRSRRISARNSNINTVIQGTPITTLDEYVHPDVEQNIIITNVCSLSEEFNDAKKRLSGTTASSIKRTSDFLTDVSPRKSKRLTSPAKVSSKLIDDSGKKQKFRLKAVPESDCENDNASDSFLRQKSALKNVDQCAENQGNITVCDNLDNSSVSPSKKLFRRSLEKTVNIRGDKHESPSSKSLKTIRHSTRLSPKQELTSTSDKNADVHKETPKVETSEDDVFLGELFAEDLNSSFSPFLNSVMHDISLQKCNVSIKRLSSSTSVIDSSPMTVPKSPPKRAVSKPSSPSVSPIKNSPFIQNQDFSKSPSPVVLLEQLSDISNKHSMKPVSPPVRRSARKRQLSQNEESAQSHNLEAESSPLKQRRPQRKLTFSTPIESKITSKRIMDTLLEEVTTMENQTEDVANKATEIVLDEMPVKVSEADSVKKVPTRKRCMSASFSEGLSPRRSSRILTRSASKKI